ncbi:MAG: two-component sensor histidine kinase, partial [bacterium]
METNRFKRIRRLILMRVLMAPFIIVMMVCGTLVYYFAVNLRDHVASELVRIADGHHRLIEQFLHERASDIEFAAASNGFEEMSRDERLTEVLNLLQVRSPAFLDLGVFDEEG